MTLIVRALYGLKLSGDLFRNHFTDFVNHVGYVPCIVNPDL